MKRTPTRAFALAAGLFIAGFAAMHAAPPASGQTGPGWIQLFDGKTLNGWDQVGAANWRVEDGAIVADKSTANPGAPQAGGHLVTKNSYKNHMIYAEFWTDENANSGIFVRCKDPKASAPGPATRSTSSTRARTRPTAPARSSISPKSSRCPRPPASGTPSRSPPRAGKSPCCSMGRRPSTSTTVCSRKGTSRCNGAQAWSSSARLRSSRSSRRDAKGAGPVSANRAGQVVLQLKSSHKDGHLRISFCPRWKFMQACTRRTGTPSVLTISFRSPWRAGAHDAKFAF